MKKLYHKINYIDDGMIALSAHPVGLHELARIHHGNGTKTLAITRCIKDRLVFLEVLEHTNHINTHDSVEFLGTSLKLCFAQDLMLGRMFNGMGEPMDGKPAIIGERIALFSPPLNIMTKALPQKTITTGIESIDWLSPIRDGERCTIMSRLGEPHHRLMAAIIQHNDADVVVVGMMGIDPFDAYFIKQQLLTERHRTIVFCHTTKDTQASCATLPDYALATAEQYALMGARVLLILSDMSALVRSHMVTQQRIHALTRKQSNPDMRAFLARFYEKARALNDAGSLTLIGFATDLDRKNHQSFEKALFDVSDHVIKLNHGLLHFGTKQPEYSLHPLATALKEFYQSGLALQKKPSLGAHVSEYEQRLMKFAKEFEESFLFVKNHPSSKDFLAKAQSLLKRYYLPHSPITL